MIFAEPIILLYCGIFVLALGLAIWRRKSFPLGETLMVILIAGVGFTLLVSWIAPAAAETPTWQPVSAGEMLFTTGYLLLVAFLLSRERPMLRRWRTHFLKEKIGTLIFKLAAFVLLPLAGLVLFGRRDAASLGFTLGDPGAQLWSAAILIFFLGGFNLIAGSGAAPLRRREFSARQLLLGFGLTFAWQIIEVGLVEEFFFRSFLQARLIGYLGSPAAGICLASLIFGLAHAPGLYLRAADKGGPLGEKPSVLNAILYAILALSPTGWFMGLLYWRTQSLLAPILVHAGLDTVAQAAEFIKGLRLRR